MDTLLVAVGGTGQVILHYYCLLYLTGSITRPFTALVIDTDEIITSLKFIQHFYQMVRGALPSPKALALPQLYPIRVAVQTTGATVHELLTNAPCPKDTGYQSPADVFFDRQTLALQATEGLYGRPALSSLIALQDACQKLASLPSNIVRDVSRIVFLSSTIGGTGAGLTVPLMSHFSRKRKGSDVQIRAVLLGQYFRPDTSRFQGAARVFESNEQLSVAALHTGLASSVQYALISNGHAGERDPHTEREGANLPWPLEHSPIWKSLNALYFLASDTTIPADTSPRRIEPTAYATRLDYARCRQAIEDAYSRAFTFCYQRVLHRMSFDCLPARIWGSPLVRAIAAYGRLAAIAARHRDDTHLKRFHREVHDWTCRLWDSNGAQYDLSTFFPKLAPRRCAVAALRSLAWFAPVTSEADFAEGFATNRAAEFTAAILLHTLLRGRPD